MTVTSNNAQLEVPSSFVYFENRDSDTGKAVARALSKYVTGSVEFPDDIVAELGRDRARSPHLRAQRLRRCGLKITSHNLRDTAEPLAIQEGASVVAVARLLGHESAATTLNHYAGLFPTDLDDIASRLDTAARLTIASQRESSDAK